MSGTPRAELADAFRALAVLVSEGVNVPLPASPEIVVPVWTGVHEWDVQLVEAFAEEVGAAVVRREGSIAATLLTGPVAYTVFALSPEMRSKLHSRPGDQPPL